MSDVFINEVSKIRNFYQTNPDQIKKFNVPSPPKEAMEKVKSSKKEYEISARQHIIAQKFKNKWLSILPETLKKKLFTDSPSEVINFSYNFAIELSNGDVEKFLNYRGGSIREELDDESINFLKLYYTSLYNDLMKLEKSRSQLSSSSSMIFDKRAQEHGMTSNDYYRTLGWIIYHTSSSFRKLPKEVWSAIHHLTVNPASLPKTVYRGMFIDGNKIKDLEKWKTKWSVGSKPRAKPSKAASWSTSIGVATQFMEAQDQIKNKKEGYAVLLKYDITDPAVVIGDLRALPDLAYWNQMEIILSSDAIEYEVAAVIPYEDYYAMKIKWDETTLKKLQNQHSAPAAGYFGVNKDDLITHYFFDINRLQIPNNIKEQWRTLSNKTLREVIDKTKYTPRGEVQDLYDLAFPLYCLLYKVNHKFANGVSLGNAKTEVLDKNSVTIPLITPFFEHTYSQSSTTILKNPHIKTIMQHLNPKFDTEKALERYRETMDYVYPKLIIDTKITLIDDSYNNMTFKFDNINPIRLDIPIDSSKIVFKLKDLIKNNDTVRKAAVDYMIYIIENGQLSKYNNIKFVLDLF